MLTYTLYQKNPDSHYIYVDLEIDSISVPEIKLQLPAWRPGRYELGNFARNIKRVDVYDEHNEPLAYTKSSKDQWVIPCGNNRKIKVTYSYYAAEMTAGSCYADRNQLYVNPVHLCMYVPESMQQPHRVQLNVPSHYKVACTLPFINHSATAESYDELADSPFIASATLRSDFYEVRNHKFHLHFQGECKPDLDRIKKDFIAFTEKQIDFWGTFPVKEYHFLFQILPARFYHGVEHQASTVIALGPSYAIMEGLLYEDLLGVSSHELFHTWNVKLIRPAEMKPYDFAKENYARTGYVYEGFTTYYGDKLLLSADVFSWKQYFSTLEERLFKHFHNYGRFNLSVADSSWETWLDGYVPGAPYRKTSIYDEGCLIAFMLDVLLLHKTEGKHSLRDVCRLLLEKFGENSEGYSENDILQLVNEVAGNSQKAFFDDYIYGTTDFTPALQEACEYLGWDLQFLPSQHVHESLYGFKLIEGQNKISLVAPYSPAWKAGLFAGDEIIAVNGITARSATGQWLRYFSSDQALKIHYISNEQLRECTLEKDSKGRNYFAVPKLRLKNNRESENAILWKCS